MRKKIVGRENAMRLQLEMKEGQSKSKVVAINKQ